jgi:hypothetical protein
MQEADRMRDAQALSMLRVLERAAQAMSLDELAATLAFDRADTERVLRELLRTRHARRVHVAPGRLCYAKASTPDDAGAAHGPRTVALGDSMTARILGTLAAHDSPLRRAEVMILGSFGSDARTASRVSATLCMLARRGRVRREYLGRGCVAYALHGTASRAAAPLCASALAAAGFRPAIDDEQLLQHAAANGSDGPAPSRAAVNQRLRRGWPPELAAALPCLRRRTG